MVPALALDEVSIRYGSTLAVDRAGFQVEPGRLLALLGPNGAGKTSLLQVCEGFRRPDAGHVRVLGQDPFADRDALMPRVGIMLQGGGGMHPWAKAGELLRLFASYAARPLDVDDLADQLGLRPFLGTTVRRLSGGEQQRLALALAIVGRPELVFLDEPTAGMDVHARHTTWAVIERLRAGGVAVVLTTHLLDEAERLADEVVIINRGRVIAAGSPAALTSSAGMERLRIDADSALPIRKLRQRLPAGVTVAESPPGSSIVDGELDAEVLAGVMAWFAARSARITSIQSQRRTLEDTFIALTRAGAA